MSGGHIFRQKQEIRSRIGRKRRELSAECVESSSAKIIAQLTSLAEFSNAQFIHCYVAWRNEVNTHGLINDLLKNGRRVAVPIIDSPNRALMHSEIKAFDELQTGTFGILEPRKDSVRKVTPSDLDLIIVPGVAFDRSGHRIGFGGGYYDAFLVDTNALKIALAYTFQIIEKIPTRSEDQNVDVLITEEGIFRFDENCYEG